MRRPVWCLGLMLGLCLCLLCGCSVLTEESGAQEQAAGDRSGEYLSVEKVEGRSNGIKDDEALYDYEPTDLVCFYVTVLGGNAADGTDHTFEEINRYRNLQGMTGVEKIRTEVLVQVGDENGPRAGEIGYTSFTANATMNVRGRTSTEYPQKSYRITFYKDAGFWRGQRAIALNKHPADVTRLRNMLYFELLRDVPSIPSLRTQYVHLYIKDMTAEHPSGVFEDYGLFTQVELPNNRYLRNHGLSVDGQLYKANLCEMFRYPETLKLATDPDYDAQAFSEILETKTGEDHTKLLEMLDAVNNYTIPTEEVLDTYFDTDNLTSYLAFNLLMGNEDSDAQNYLLYSPLDAKRWYYLCWDGDDSLAYTEDILRNNQWQGGEWTRGISNYWGVVLFNRALRLPSFRSLLSEKMELLHGTITQEKIASLIRKYRTVTDRFTSSLPDSEQMRETPQVREAIYEAMPGDIEKNYQAYLLSLDKPMPFYQWEAAEEGGELVLTWDESYDFDGEFLRYDVQLCRDWKFEDVLWEGKGLLGTEARLPLPGAGTYFWKVTVTNESGFTQESFDSVTTSSGIHAGMRRFTIQADGTVVNGT